MIAVETNVLVRVLTRDDPAQARRAAKILQSEKVFIPKTVMLETEWVLRYAYRIETKAIMNGFKKLLGLANVAVEDPDAVVQAISSSERGLDFADSLHIASSRKARQFVTFHKSLVRKARQVTPLEVVPV
jgi:predicted nucleic-acid-binding protein